MTRNETDSFGRYEDEIDPRMPIRNATKKVTRAYREEIDPRIPPQYAIEAWADPEDVPILSKKILEIEARGDAKVSPFWVIWELGLGTFSLAVKPQVIKMLEDTQYGHDIGFIRTKRGIRIIADNVRPLLAAFVHLQPTLTLELMGSAKNRKKLDEALHG